MARKSKAVKAIEDQIAAINNQRVEKATRIERLESENKALGEVISHLESILENIGGDNGGEQ